MTPSPESVLPDPPEPRAVPRSDDPTPQTDVDVVVLGGAFSGAASSLLLRRRRCATRVLIAESAESFDRKVGEATVEISGFFLHRILGLYDHLAREHLPKHGLRYWFTDRPDRTLFEMSEVGPGESPRLPSFQLDRSKLDEYLLALAEEEGAEVVRPGKVVEVEHGWPVSRVRIETPEGERTVSTRWVVDASGRHAFLARRRRLHSRFEDHATSAAWGRWTGVLDLDGPKAVGADPLAPRLPPIGGSRRLATNHFCGYGWWCWVIPLAGGQTSIGVVWDKRLFDLPGDGRLPERYESFVRSQPGLRDLVSEAELDRDDYRSYSHLAYRTSRYCDPGWLLVGDAAAFLDPYYSPGLDHAAFTVWAAADLIRRDLDGELATDEAMQTAVDEQNAEFRRSYDRWFDALYRDKYEILGDAELTACSFAVDTALYYLGVVGPVAHDPELLRHPMFGQAIPQTRIATAVMSFFRRRMVRLARARRLAGTYGRRNAGWRRLSEPFALGGPSARILVSALVMWLRLELGSLAWRVGRGRSGDLSRPVEAEAAPVGRTATAGT